MKRCFEEIVLQRLLVSGSAHMNHFLHGAVRDTNRRCRTEQLSSAVSNVLKPVLSLLL